MADAHNRQIRGCRRHNITGASKCSSRVQASITKPFPKISDDNCSRCTHYVACRRYCATYNVLS
jgi:hypothetical protein